jgi:predicted O-methyltransferase YrrM
MAERLTEIIERLDWFVGSRGTGCYVYETPTLIDPTPGAPYGFGASFESPTQQSRKEIHTLIEVLLQVSPRNITLETGAGEWVGSHFLWQMLFDKIITIEISKPIIDKISYETSEKDIFIISDSRNALDLVKEKTDYVDVLFLDSKHLYEITSSEYKLYAPLVKKGGLIIFHDAISPEFPEMETFMKDFREGKIDGKTHKMVVIDDSPSLKIGIAYMSTDDSELPVPSGNKWQYW